jgi:hypothetical protein
MSMTEQEIESLFKRNILLLKAVEAIATILEKLQQEMQDARRT